MTGKYSESEVAARQRKGIVECIGRRTSSLLGNRTLGAAEQRYSTKGVRRRQGGSYGFLSTCQTRSLLSGGRLEGGSSGPFHVSGLCQIPEELNLQTGTTGCPLVMHISFSKSVYMDA